MRYGIWLLATLIMTPVFGEKIADLPEKYSVFINILSFPSYNRLIWQEYGAHQRRADPDPKDPVRRCKDL
jgi:hypothetical protein